MSVHHAEPAAGLAGAGHHAQRGRRQFLLLTSLLVAFAWLSLWAWELSPYGRYLDHGNWTTMGSASGGHWMCRSRVLYPVAEADPAGSPAD